MWSDNETEIDFLNFTSVADTIAEIIVQAKGRPVSIGVSGAWGVGKSSMVKLVRSSMSKGESKNYLFVDFNAWLYQGYDDVRSSLIEIIAKEIETEAKKRQKGIEKATGLLKRINWLRVLKLSATTATSLAFGLPPVGAIGEVIKFGQSFAADKVDEKVMEQLEKTGVDLYTQAAGLFKEQVKTSPPEAIHAIRAGFEEALDELGVTLVVMIDDLDRCLPETTISTLEAVRLFLFLKNTAFVIAADTGMIKHAVRKHFDIKASDGKEYVENYFDKLIQVPIRVPQLGTQEVRAYLILLYVENSSLDDESKRKVREAVCARLSLSWKGERLDSAFMKTIGITFPPDLTSKIDTASRLAPMLTQASDIRGNPRLIKRFLNALSIRLSIAKAHNVAVDEAVLTKLLLFERCGNTKAYGELMTAVGKDTNGQPGFLTEWEEVVSAKKISRPQPWDDSFFDEWLALKPALGKTDLRGALYVSREHLPLYSPEDRLSPEAVATLTALIDHPDMAGEVEAGIQKLSGAEVTVVMDRLLDKARQEQEWGIPDILTACLAVTRNHISQGTRLAAFLMDRPMGQITAAIVPKIGGEPWASTVFAKWSESDVGKPVKVAITRSASNGNL